LPVAPARAEVNGPIPSPGPNGPPVRAPRRVLVVDDNRDAADSLAELLRLAGHDVRTAYDGPSALEVVVGYRPEAILLDLGMPGRSGQGVARRRRERDGPRGVLLVALPGGGQPEDRRRTREAGFDHPPPKPADPATIEGLLASLPPPGCDAGHC